MNDTPTIAVICASGRRTGLTCETLHSVVAQTLKPRRLIIIHDRAEETVLAALRDRVAETMPAAQLICAAHHPDATEAAARNIALNYVGDCRYVHFASADILLPDDFYEQTARSLANRPDYAVAMVRRLDSADGAQTEIDADDLIKDLWTWLLRSKSEIAGMVLLRDSVFAKAGKFNPSLELGADIDFFARTALHGAWCSTNCTASRASASQSAQKQSHYPDYYRRWALIYENLVDTYRLRERVARDLYRSHLATTWCEAGLELLTHQRVEEARDCFVRSLSWRLFNPAMKHLMSIARIRGYRYVP